MDPEAVEEDALVQRGQRELLQHVHELAVLRAIPQCSGCGRATQYDGPELNRMDVPPVLLVRFHGSPTRVCSQMMTAAITALGTHALSCTKVVHRETGRGDVRDAVERATWG